MPRPPRLQTPGATYHVTTRGNRRQEIFIDTRDRVRFLQLVQEVVALLGWDCHAYCLMTNHYHLLVQTPDADISRGMHRLNGVYAKWFNWRHNYGGHLFERRFQTARAPSSWSGKPAAASCRSSRCSYSSAKRLDDSGAPLELG